MTVSRQGRDSEAGSSTQSWMLPERAGKGREKVPE
jgi:hypothetical protein